MIIYKLTITMRVETASPFSMIAGGPQEIETHEHYTTKDLALKRQKEINDSVQLLSIQGFSPTVLINELEVLDSLKIPEEAVNQMLDDVDKAIHEVGYEK